MWNYALHTNMNFPAPISVLAFLAAGGGVALAVLGIAIFCFARKLKLALLLLKLTGTAAVVYFALLLGFSLASHATTLAAGQEKYFCEIDCHLAYSVVSVKTETETQHVQYVITLRTRFDPNTISSRRPKDYPLTPSPRTVLLLDNQGHTYAPQSVSGTSLMTRLIPGQSYTTQLDFHLPAHAEGTKLLVATTPGWPDHVLIGDENSWLHKKTYLRL